MIGEYILLALLLVSAIFIVVVVTLQKSNDEGLSGTIAGGSETYYGKDKSAHSDRPLHKITLVASIVFVVAVIVTYVVQPDFTNGFAEMEHWHELVSDIYKDLFKG